MARREAWRRAAAFVAVFASSCDALAAPAASAARPACVVVPGFLYGSEDFVPLARSLRQDFGVDATVAPIKWWHWLPCLGGRSVRPILERIAYAVDYASTAEAVEVEAPFPSYSPSDLWFDFRETPGGVLEVGGSSDPDRFPDVAPRGGFRDDVDGREGARKRRCGLVGHSAAGWISRIYLSSRPYGGKAYGGASKVDRLVTLGSPHTATEGVAFANVAWANAEGDEPPVRSLAVAGAGFAGAEASSFTRDSYAFCGVDAADVDGDGVTPLRSALAFPGSETLVLPGAGKGCEIPNFKGSYLGRFPLVSADFWTRDHLSERSRP